MSSQADEKPEYPGFFKHLYNQIRSDVESLSKGEVPRKIEYKKDDRPQYPGLITHLWNQFWADIESVREGKIPRPIRYRK